MADDKSRIFPNLAPPAGGLERLRRQLDREQDNRRTRWQIPVVAATAIFICSAVWLVTSEIRSESRRDQFSRALASLKAESNPALVRLGLADAPSEAVTVPTGQRKRVAVERVAVPDPGVIYYRLAILDSGESGAIPKSR